MTRSKTCEICETRPATEIMNGSVAYCYPCSTMADMENHHSDWAHDAILALGPGKKLPMKGYAFKTTAERDAYMEAERAVMETCWVCKPELDETKLEYVVRAGTSRAGIVLTTPQRVPGREKAQIVRERLEEAGFGETVRVSFRKGITTLTMQGYTFTWDDSGNSSRGTGGTHKNAAGTVRKIRNVSEMLRRLAEERFSDH